MTAATQKQIRSYLSGSTQDLQQRFDVALASLANVTLYATENIAAEAALVLWAAFKGVPSGIVAVDGVRRIEVRPLGELGPLFAVVCGVQS